MSSIIRYISRAREELRKPRTREALKYGAAAVGGGIAGYELGQATAPRTTVQLSGEAGAALAALVGTALISQLNNPLSQLMPIIVLFIVMMFVFSILQKLTQQGGS